MDSIIQQLLVLYFVEQNLLLHNFYSQIQFKQKYVGKERTVVKGTETYRKKRDCRSIRCRSTGLLVFNIKCLVLFFRKKAREKRHLFTFLFMFFQRKSTYCVYGCYGRHGSTFWK